MSSNGLMELLGVVNTDINYELLPQNPNIVYIFYKRLVLDNPDKDWIGVSYHIINLIKIQ